MKTEKHKILRIVLTEKHNVEGSLRYKRIKGLINEIADREYEHRFFDFILTPGGFLTFDFPTPFSSDIDIKAIKSDDISQLQEKANEEIISFLGSLSYGVFRKLRGIANYISLGIDGYNSDNIGIELVAIYDLKLAQVIHWTGKSYPTEHQKRRLIKIKDLDSHFITLNNQRIMLLGCHDLNMFNPRGRAKMVSSSSDKKKITDAFISKCLKFNPEIILHHPHTTDTPNVWNTAWGTVKKELLKLEHFASGINFFNENGIRGDLKSVLEKTKKGDVIDFSGD